MTKQRILLALVPALVSIAACSSSGSASHPASDFDAGPVSDPTGFATLSLSPASEGFGAVPVGKVSPPITFVVANTGASVSPTLTATTAVNGSSSPFVIDSDTCSGHPLVAGASCSLALHFAPLAPGVAQALLEISTSYGGFLDASLAGFGGPAGTGALSIQPTSIDFGSVQVGAQAGLQTAVLVNTGRSALPSVTTALSGSGAGAFSLSNDTCTGNTLVSGGGCNLSVSFKPETTGVSSTAALTVSSGTTTATAALSGSSPPPATLTLTPSDGGFGACTVGAPCGAPLPFTLTNTGETQSGNVSPTISGSDAADFAIVNDGCALAFLQPSTSCGFSVAFTPSRVGLETATIVTGGAATPPTAQVTGTGSAPDGGAVTDAGTTADAGP